MKLTQEEYVEAMEYVVDFEGFGGNDKATFSQVCIDIMALPLENYLTPERGMAHLPEYSEPIDSGHLYCGVVDSGVALVPPTHIPSLNDYDLSYFLSGAAYIGICVLGMYLVSLT